MINGVSLIARACSTDELGSPSPAGHGRFAVKLASRQMVGNFSLHKTGHR